MVWHTLDAPVLFLFLNPPTSNKIGSQVINISDFGDTNEEISNSKVFTLSSRRLTTCLRHCELNFSENSTLTGMRANIFLWWSLAALLICELICEAKKAPAKTKKSKKEKSRTTTTPSPTIPPSPVPDPPR